MYYPVHFFRMMAERPRTASVSRNRPKTLTRLLSTEEEEKLNHWEALKRRESEDEERALRQLEAEAHRQRQEALERERAKLAEAVERERVETEARYGGKHGLSLCFLKLCVRACWSLLCESGNIVLHNGMLE